VVKRLLVAAVCAGVMLWSVPAHAAPIIVPTADSFIGTLLVDFVAGTQTMDVAGASPADVVDGGVIISGAILADALLPNDAVFTDSLDFLQFDFGSTFASATIDLAAGTWTQLVAGTLLAPLTNPALSAFLVPNNVALLLLLGEPVITTDPETGDPLTALVTFSLDSIAAPAQVEPIPEPATLFLVGTGIVASIRARRSNRRKDASL
jgi:PEP-CTERM motif-containing protein